MQRMYQPGLRQQMAQILWRRPDAEELWQSFSRTLILQLHILATLICSTVIFRRESQAALIENPPMTAVCRRAFATGDAHMAEMLVNLIEQVHGLLWAPTPVVLAAIGTRMRWAYAALSVYNLVPSLPFLACVWAAQICAPHLLLMYMQRVLAIRAAVGQAPQPRSRVARARMLTASTPAAAAATGMTSSAIAASLTGKAADADPGSSGPSSTLAAGSAAEKQLAAERDLAEIRALEQQHKAGPAASATACAGPGSPPPLAGSSGAAHEEGASRTPPMDHAPETNQAKNGQPMDLAAADKERCSSLRSAGVASEPDSMSRAESLALAESCMPLSEDRSETHPPGTGPKAISEKTRPLVPHPSRFQQEVRALASGQLRPSTLRALQNTVQMIEKASGKQGYRSRLLQPQVVIKLAEAEPEQLCSDVLEATDAVLQTNGHVRLLTARASVRRGCALLQFDLMQLSDGTDSSHQPDFSSIDASLVKGWLEALLPDGSALPDGSLAHISVGGHQLEARWQQEQATWVVALAATTSLPPPQLSLLYVDQPVARLPARETTTSTLHRASLLLRAGSPTRSVTYQALDPASAPEDQPAESDADAPVVVRCAARTSWGSHLPVTVAGFEQGAQDTDGGQEHDASPSEAEATLHAVTLDVDLGSAPHAGLVQLELWAGRTLLATAPLLVLPPQAPASEELKHHLQGCSWEGDSSSQAAWLTDLGQVVTAAEAIRAWSAGQASTSSSSAPGSWGGVRESTSRRLVHDRRLLGGMLSLAEGVLAYAQDMGLTHTAVLVESATKTIQQRREQLEAQEGSMSGGQPAPVPASPLPDDCSASCAADSLASDCVPQDSKKKKSSLEASSVVSSAKSVAHDERPSAPKPATLRLRHPAHGRPSLDPSPFGPTPTRPTAPRAPGGSSYTGGAGSSNSSGSGAAGRAGPAGVKAPGTPHHPIKQLQLHHQLRPGSQHHHQLVQPTLKECILAFLFGFRDRELERQYQFWVALRSRRMVAMHSLVFLGWVMACMARSASEGFSTFLGDLPTHITVGVPYLATILLDKLNMHMWQEVSLVSHAIGRALGCGAAAMGLAGLWQWPHSYSVICKIRLDVWMRLVALLVANASLVGFSIAVLSACGNPLHTVVGRIVLPRICALAVGGAMDVSRRFSFLRDVVMSP